MERWQDGVERRAVESSGVRRRGVREWASLFLLTAQQACSGQMRQATRIGGFDGRQAQAQQLSRLSLCVGSSLLSDHTQADAEQHLDKDQHFTGKERRKKAPARGFMSRNASPNNRKGNTRISVFQGTEQRNVRDTLRRSVSRCRSRDVSAVAIRIPRQRTATAAKAMRCNAKQRKHRIDAASPVPTDSFSSFCLPFFLPWHTIVLLHDRRFRCKSRLQ